MIMLSDKLISARVFCSSHEVDISFVQSLHHSGLIALLMAGNEWCLQVDELPELERFVRLHAGLEINLEGIEAIGHLLNRLKEKEKQIHSLQIKLSIHEQQ